jgi:hypothetical protein
MWSGLILTIEAWMPLVAPLTLAARREPESVDAARESCWVGLRETEEP